MSIVREVYMRKKHQRDKQSDSIFPIKIDQLQKLLNDKFKNDPDLIFSIYENHGKKLAVFSIPYMTDTNVFADFLLEPLLSTPVEWTNQSILKELPLSDGKTTESLEDILEKLLVGEVFIYIEQEKEIVSYLILNKEKRQLTKAETESVVLGPKVGFTESLVTNLNVIRWNIRSTDLVLEKFIVGNKFPREVRLVYMKSIANQSDVNTMRQRLQDLDVDTVDDSTVLMQYIEDSQSSVFPQFYSTELPDRFSYTVSNGKLGVLVEGSPTGIIAPSTLFSFFESTEDMYMRWNVGSFLRILRFFAMVISIILTPAYVAAVTYHYELIPTPLLITLGQSRAAVPFPPLLEALILELLIELLREAGARLPTKVGQTMGIVGGVVIGQAAVVAGLTSSILIIVVTLSALASFTVPNYLMGATIRVIRFPMMFLAGLFGIIGMMFGMCFLVIHLLKITSLGRPYLSPIYPLNWQDFNKVLFRLPLKFQFKYARLLMPKEKFKYSKQEANKKRDIDE